MLERYMIVWLKFIYHKLHLLQYLSILRPIMWWRPTTK